MARKRKAVPQDEETLLVVDESDEETTSGSHAVGAQPYWVGTLPECPKQNVVLGGIDFPQYTEQIIDQEGGLTQRNRRNGDVKYLTADQVKAIKAAGKRKVVRSQGALTTILNTDHKRYRPHTNDKPLGQFVYLVPLDDMNKLGPMWRDEVPEGMIA